MSGLVLSLPLMCWDLPGRSIGAVGMVAVDRLDHDELTKYFSLHALPADGCHVALFLGAEREVRQTYHGGTDQKDCPAHTDNKTTAKTRNNRG